MARTVRDLMTRTVVAAPVDAPFKELVRLMHEYRVSALPVLGEAGVIVGVVSEADLLLKEDPDLRAWHLFEGPRRRAERRKATGLLARDLMTSPAVTISPEASVADAACSMHDRRVKRLPVIDPEGHVLGVISRIDLLCAFLREDEEIAHQVHDVIAEEFASYQDGFRVIVEEGVVTVEGRVELKSHVPELVHRLEEVEGVVAVEDHVAWDEDDTVKPVSPVPWVGI
jgi:CBS domain-containing protein